jgi:hypothetical protein
MLADLQRLAGTYLRYIALLDDRRMNLRTATAAP